MKRILLFTFILGFVISGFAQTRVAAPKHLRNKAVVKIKPTAETMNFQNQEALVTAYKNGMYTPEEEAVATTRYDLQSNASMQNRIAYFDDGTIGVAYTFGLDDAAVFPDRGTGYNYFDGTEWGDEATERIEGDRTGWPAYAKHGENGELVVAHYSGAAIDGLALSMRPEKGTGDWQMSDFFGPAGNEGLLWPRMATGGVDNSVIHIIPLTRPVANQGAIYEGMDGALLYCRSTDGGATWDPQNELLDDINSDFYVGWSGDTYEIQARDDVVAFLTGDSWTDLVLMKSEDGGDTWEKTVIWENPYPFFDPSAPVATDTFYCADGAHALAIDAGGKVHVAFGINRSLSDGAQLSWFPLVDGLGYWNEDRTTFSSDKNALNPYDDAIYTELEEDYSLVGWAQDVNGNGVWDILGEVGLYYVGTSSMPQIHVDDDNQVFILYSSITEGFDNGLQDYRHLWGRSSPNGGEWWGTFVDLTGDLIHIFDECVFSSIAPTSDDFLYVCYQLDTEPGLHVRGDEDPPGDNKINFMKINKDEFGVGIEEKPAILEVDVAQNQPNPFSATSTVYVNLRKASELSMEVTNMMGQVVYRIDKGQTTAGLQNFTIDGADLSSGVYFYTVNAGKSSITKKMIVE